MTIKVLIIDDSALVRNLLTQILSSDPEIEVVGTAADPYIARDKIKKLNPDVLTLDVEMPRMDGVTFLKNLMRLRPMPVVMISTLTAKGAEVTLSALEIGAVDFIHKPAMDFSREITNYTREITAKVKMAAAARVREYRKPAVSKLITKTVPDKLSADAIVSKKQHLVAETTDKIIAIGASTGGTEAVREVLEVLPGNLPGMVITQHIPPGFADRFAERLDKACSFSVKLAKNGDLITAGTCYVAPGDKHLLVERNGARYVCRLHDGPPVNRHKPSVDVMFRTVAQNVGKNALGILLTGMGEDGAKGMLEMQQAGATTLAQDEKSSVVWGMPGAAYKLGAVDKLLPLHKVAQEILQQFG